MRKFLLIGLLVGVISTSARAGYRVEAVWTPERPNSEEAILVQVSGTGGRGGWLHWGVNAKGNAWEQPAEAYRSEGSRLDGNAVRTPLQGPSDSGVYHVWLGPFNRAEQVVRTVDFVVSFDDGTWENNGGKDFHIEVARSRVMVQPSSPGPSERVMVRVRDSKAGGLLRWGVNADANGWRCPHPFYRPGGSMESSDGAAVDSPLSAPDAQGVSETVLGPFDFGGQVVTSIHMAVHWENDWDSNFGRNYRVDIRPASGGVPLAFAAPASGNYLWEDISCELSGVEHGRVELWLDGQPLARLLTPPYQTVIPVGALSFGEHRLSAQAEVGGLAVVDFWRGPKRVTQYYPWEAPLGATVGDDGVCTFALYAPGKRFVSLVADFNGFDEASDPMWYSSNGIWWLRKKLAPGDYRYQYAIDGRLKLADPYAREVDWRDEEGRQTHKPELARTVLRVGEPPFEWAGEEYARPPLERVVLYELGLNDFTHNQGFTGLVARLDYLRDLGVNTLEVMPWTEFPGDKSWGYNPAFHGAPEAVYGSPDELMRLVNEAHQRGLGMVLDLVMNHADGNGPLFQLYGGDYDASPYFYLFLGENWGFPDFDQASEAVKRYQSDMIGRWLRDYRLDGIRHDATQWVGWQGYNDWGASWLAYAGRQADAASYQIAEHLPIDPALMNQTEMDTSWDEQFRWRIRDMLVGGWLNQNDFKSAMDPLPRGFTNVLQRVAYLESHDEERVMRDLVGKGYAADECERRAISTLALILTAPGVPMLYAGQELGEASGKTLEYNPVDWKALDRESGQRILRAAQALCRARTSQPALQTGGIEFVEFHEQRGYAVYRRQAGWSQVAVAVQFGRVPVDIAVPLDGGHWRFTLTGTEFFRDAGEPPLRVRLQPGEACVIEKR